MPAQELSLREMINPTARQQMFLDTITQFPICLFGGAAAGGKSYIIRWFCVRLVMHAFALHGVRNAVAGLFCEDYPALQDRHLSKWCIPSSLGEVHETRLEGLRFKLRDELGGGMVLLRNLDDPNKYDSAEFIGIAIDEFCKNPFEVLEQLRKRLRWAASIDQPHLPCGGRCADRNGEMVRCERHAGQPAWNFPVALASNPLGQGHAQTKRVFIDRKFSGTVAHLAPIKHLFAFVPARAEDNPYNPPDYKATHLDTLPPKLRAAYAEGRWDVPEGQFFTNFDLEQRQISGPSVAAIVQPWWPAWIATDWGFEHYAVTLWATRGLVKPDFAYTYLDRQWATARTVTIIYRELIRRETDAPIYAQQICSLTGPEERKEIKAYWLSPDAKQKRSSQHTVQEEIAATMLKNGMPQPYDADNQRVAGWRFMYSMIERDELFIASSCVETLEAFPQVQYDSEGPDPEDALKTDDLADDVMDAARYLLKSQLDPRILAPYSVRAKEEIVKWADPTTRAIKMREFELREKLRGKRVARWRGH